MNRQILINYIVCGVMGNAAYVVWLSGHPVCAVLIFVAWIVGMINSLYPVRQIR